MTRSRMILGIGATIVAFVIMATAMQYRSQVVARSQPGDPAYSAADQPAAIREARDAGALSSARVIVSGIETYQSLHGELPDAGEVAPNRGLSEALPDWPPNPWDDEPMHPGDGLGDYSYEPDPDGTFAFFIVVSYGKVNAANR